MSSFLITNIKCLVNTREQNQLLRGRDLMNLPCIDDAFLIIEDGQIVDYGTMEKLKTINHKPKTTSMFPGNLCSRPGVIRTPILFLPAVARMSLLIRSKG